MLTAITNLTACGTVKSALNAVDPSHPMFSADFPPPGPPNYQQGMMDGCKSTTAALSANIQTASYNQFYNNWYLSVYDDVYYGAWKDGFAYCKYSADGSSMAS